MIAIGGSLGSTQALRGILSRLPASFAPPVVVVLHRHRESDDALIEMLAKSSQLPVGEACDKDVVAPGRVTIGPCDYHLLIEGDHFSLSVDEPVQYARPSIDVLFESAADEWGDRTIAVVLTGGNQDGARGAVRVREAGGQVIVQEPATAECPIMPAAVIAMGGASFICQLDEIPRLLVRLAEAKGAA
ncbi:MAG TPA: chemotaxis protein CheB [Opitutaceae bacterium]|jgi:two-component system chemotaxis response regulator CheB